MIKNAPYKFSEFESITFKFGLGDNLVNQYNSKTGNYQYLNSKDSLVKTNVKLTKDDLLYLHRKAAEQGFWNFPEVFSGSDKTKSLKSPHYYIEYNYKNKSKHVLFDADYNEKQKLGDAARQLVKEITNVINDAQDRHN
ncbi:hypothetical protein [Daejeonella oryzae]|uniref:hypothetical protein n=1 Tax=Daejeonella oryzae TaxID=1122943 RepID=UPI00055B5D2B|nr:hypothetical protein [Daejeonella oryzae]